jgi:NAD(P)-dependent dehydrogenase (short-subunit alcohol dehydrogenase family)
MTMSDSVKSGKVCVVVGVGEGLAMALAVRFAQGYKVALIARSSEVVGKTAGEIKSAGGIALPIQSDATIEAEIAGHTIGSIKNSVRSKFSSTTAAVVRWAV